LVLKVKFDPDELEARFGLPDEEDEEIIESKQATQKITDDTTTVISKQESDIHS
jgi:hypothetical protein